MRKYFLLSAVAMLMTTTANATTDYAEVTAKATIQIANKMECTDLNFGTIVVKQNNAASKLIFDYDAFANGEFTATGDILSYTGMKHTHCLFSSENAEADIDSYERNIILTGENGGTMSVDIELLEADTNYADFGGTLNIPEKVTAGTYTGSFGVSTVY